MFLFKHLTTTKFLISSALALSIRGQNNGKSFTLHQVRSRLSDKSEAVVSLFTYDKFNKRVSNSVERAPGVSNDTIVATPTTLA